MWIVGDRGQSEPWQRSSGVKMTKGENGVYTGVLSLPKGTRFELNILESTVDGTSGGNNVWSAVHYKSVLNSDASYDFGEFTNNLIPNGSFEEGAVKWTPSNCIIERDYAHGGGHFLATFPYSNIATSDTFVIPPNQDLRYATYVRVSTDMGIAIVEIKDVNTHDVLFEAQIRPQSADQWIAFAGTFKTGGSPVTAQVVCTNVSKTSFSFDDMSLVMP